MYVDSKLDCTSYPKIYIFDDVYTIPKQNVTDSNKHFYFLQNGLFLQQKQTNVSFETMQAEFFIYAGS